MIKIHTGGNVCFSSKNKVKNLQDTLQSDLYYCEYSIKKQALEITGSNQQKLKN